MGVICIYHKNCLDGFGAAWALWREMPNATFIAGTYNSPPPDVSGADVYIVDFSYKRPVLIELAKSANKITIIDHHKTAAEDLVDLPANVFTVFNLEKSGAILAWEFFNNEIPAPALLLHIQDRDLWQFSLENTREILAAVMSYPYDFEVWQEMQNHLEDILSEGIAIERKHKIDLEALLPNAYEVYLQGFLAPCLNAPFFFASEAGEILAKGKPFSIVWYQTKNGVKYSLRSEKEDGVDVSKIAALYGGGGHKNAAGFFLPWGHERIESLGRPYGYK